MTRNSVSPETPRSRSQIRVQWVASLLLASFCQSCGGGGAVTSLEGTHPGGSTPGPVTQPYFLMRKFGPGITATPAQDGTYTAGTMVNYGFVGTDTAANILVTQDGKPVAALGTVKMDQDHLFAAVVDNQPGARAPQFSGQTAGGQTVKLSDYRGKWVFVDFSEVPCPGSVGEASYLQAHYAAFKARGMDIVTVLVHGPTGGVVTAADLTAWQQTYGLSFPVITDLASATGIYNHGITGNSTDFPSGYIVDDKGIIRAKFIGFDGPTIDAALAVLFP